MMATIGIAALIANGAVAAMLYAYRSGDANMRSIWLCSRKDVIGNITVLLAALGVFGTGSGWPDFAVAAVIASLGISGAWQITRQASSEINRGYRFDRSSKETLVGGAR
jgi:Co/Zn/Cd efflux system component